MSRRGFTLVELLVVIGIVAILIGLIVPAVARARGQAVATACASNLRQMFLAMNAYADDSGRLPGVEFGGASAAWATRLAPYLARSGQPSDAVMHCPAVPSDQMQAATQYLPPTMSYGVNSFIMLPQWQGRRNARMDTARIILMADKAPSFDDWAHSEDGVYYADSFQAGVPGSRVQVLAHQGSRSRRHGNGRLGNAVMADGHVAGLSGEELRASSGRWYWGSPAMNALTIDLCTCCGAP